MILNLEKMQTPKDKRVVQCEAKNNRIKALKCTRLRSNLTITLLAVLALLSSNPRTFTLQPPDDN